MKMEATISTKGGKGDPKAIRKRTSEGIHKSLAVLEIQHKQREIIKGGKGPAAKGKFTSRTGQLARSYHIYFKSGALFGSYGSELKRAGVIEGYGKKETVIKKKDKLLTVPIAPAAKNRRASDFADLFPFRSRKGNLLLGRVRGGHLEALFALKESVTIPARPTVQNAVKHSEKKRMKIIEGALVTGTWEAI